MKFGLFAAVALGAGLVFAEGEYHWTGAVSGAWTEPGNWLENTVPGTGETAVFDRASVNTTIDVAGMTPIAKLLVTGAETPSYVFGTAESQKFMFDESGWIDVDATVTTEQTVAATVYYFCETKVQKNFYFRNNSSAILKLAKYGGPSATASGWLGAWNTYYYGTGLIQKIGSSDFTSGGGPNLRMCLSEGGCLEYTVSGAFYQICTDGTGTRQHIVIDKGCTLESSNPSSIFVHGGDQDEIWLSGEGTFYLSDNSLKAADCCYLGSAGHSGIVTFDCKFKRRAKNTTTFGFWNPTTYYFNCVNDITGKLQYHNGGGDKKVYVVSFGSSETPGALGTGVGAIQWDATSSLLYTGAGDTLFNPLILNSTAKLFNNGTGTFRIESEISGAGTLNLSGGAFALACNVPNTLNVAAGTPYAFVKKEGEEFANYSVGKLVFNGNATLTLEDGVTVEPSEYQRASGAKLNIVTTGGKLKLYGLERGAAPSWITVNGAPAVVGEGGEIGSFDDITADVEIDARGGAVSDSETDIVSVETAEGEGETISLGNPPTTSAWVLRQKQTVQPAVVELQDGETFKVERLHVATGAQPLRVQAADGAAASLDGLTTAAGVTVSGGAVELGGNLTVGDVRLGQGGVLKITDGNIAGGTLLQCPNDSDYGYVKAFYQTGGIVNSSGAGNRVGSSQGYVYSELSGGELNVSGSAYYGCNGLALLAVTGGTTTFTSGAMYLQAHNGGFAVCHQTGGVFQQTRHGDDLYVGGGQNGNAVWTIEGEGAVTRIRSSDDGRNFVLANGLYSSTATPAQGILNVNDGGTVHAGSIVAAKGHPASAKAYANFNGGIFYNNYSYGRVFGETGGNYFDPVDRVTLFEKGMTMQTGVDCSTKVPLDAPTGKGISAIAWTDTTTTFIGAPLVQIVGDGFGATAVADYDPETRTVSAIRVTSPGCDYTTATAKVRYGAKLTGGGETIAEIPCELKDNVSGGFTKTGGSTFTFSVPNTYTGPTVVRAGTLTLGADDVIDPRSVLVLDGGTLNLNNKHQVFSSIACNGGTVKNGKVEVSGLTVDFDEVKAGRVLKVDLSICTLPPKVKPTLVNFDTSKLSLMDKRYALIEFAGGVMPEDLDLSDLVLPKGWRISTTGGIVKIVYRPTSFVVLGSGSGVVPQNPGVRVSEEFGYDPVDATEYLQRALDSGYRKIIIDRQAGPWYTAPLRLDGKTDKEIVFEDGVELCAMRTGDSYKNPYLSRLLHFANCTNITLKGGGTLRMWREDYASLKPPYDEDPSNAQFRHALSFAACSHVVVDGLTIAESGGDGICVAPSASGAGDVCTDVTIRNVTCTRNYRQGLSVTGVDGLLIEDSRFERTGETYGTAPMAGIDFEPSDARDRVANCVVRRCTFSDNCGAGIDAFLEKLPRGIKDISITVEDCDISGNGAAVRDYQTRVCNPGGGVFYGAKGFVRFDNVRVTEANGETKVLSCTRSFGPPEGVTYPATVDTFDFGAATVVDEKPGEVVPLNAGNVRGEGVRVTFYAAQAGDVRISCMQKHGWQKDPVTTPMRLENAAGEKIGDDLAFPGETEAVLPITVPAAGFYTLVADTGSSALIFTKSDVPIAYDNRPQPIPASRNARRWAFLTEDRKMTGEFWLSVPEAASGLALAQTTQSGFVPIENVAMGCGAHVKLFDPEGALLWDKDNPALEDVFDVPAAQVCPGLWKVHFEPPTTGNYYMFSYDVAGIAPFYFLSKDKYWK